jgi:hypothetical protein
MAATEVKAASIDGRRYHDSQTIRKDDDGLNALLSRQREAIWGLMIALVVRFTNKDVQRNNFYIL